MIHTCHLKHLRKHKTLAVTGRKHIFRECPHPPAAVSPNDSAESPVLLPSVVVVGGLCDGRVSSSSCSFPKPSVLKTL